MLVLSRKDGEQITIGENIVVTMISGMDGRARIGIVAPKGVPVHRREVYDAIREERKES